MNWNVRVAERAEKRFYPERRLADVLDIRRRTTTTYRHYPQAATRGW